MCLSLFIDQRKDVFGFDWVVFVIFRIRDFLVLFEHMISYGIIGFFEFHSFYDSNVY